MSEEDDSDADLDEQVTERIETNEVIIFMKGTASMPLCGYSQRAVKLVSTHVDDPETVDVLPQLEAYREALEEHSGRNTIPQVFVDEEFVGGSDVLKQLDEQDSLEETLSV